eukprot:4537527-Prymnesium_polylepis.1
MSATASSQRLGVGKEGSPAGSECVRRVVGAYVIVRRYPSAPRLCGASDTRYMTMSVRRKAVLRRYAVLRCLWHE